MVPCSLSKLRPKLRRTADFRLLLPPASLKFFPPCITNLPSSSSLQPFISHLCSLHFDRTYTIKEHHHLTCFSLPTHTHTRTHGGITRSSCAFPPAWPSRSPNVAFKSLLLMRFPFGLSERTTRRLRT